MLGAWKRFGSRFGHFPLVLCQKQRSGEKRDIEIVAGEAAGMGLDVRKGKRMNRMKRSMKRSCAGMDNGVTSTEVATRQTSRVLHVVELVCLNCMIEEEDCDEGMNNWMIRGMIDPSPVRATAPRSDDPPWHLSFISRGTWRWTNVQCRGVLFQSESVGHSALNCAWKRIHSYLPQLSLLSFLPCFIEMKWKEWWTTPNLVSHLNLTTLSLWIHACTLRNTPHLSDQVWMMLSCSLTS